VLFKLAETVVQKIVSLLKSKKKGEKAILYLSWFKNHHLLYLDCLYLLKRVGILPEA